jgi:hypothetical protein
MPKSRTWDVEEIAERRKMGRFRAAVSTAAQTIMVVALGSALSPVAVHTMSAATSDYSVVSVRSRSFPAEVRARRGPRRGEFDPDVQRGMSTSRLGQGVPAFFRETDPGEIDDVDLPLL